MLENLLTIFIYPPNNLFAISPPLGSFLLRFCVEPFIVKERVTIRAESVLRERARYVVGYEEKKIYIISMVEN